MNPATTTSASKSLPLATSADALPERIELAGGGVLLFWRELIPANMSTAIFEELRDEVPWEQMLFRGNSEPRLTKWMGDHPYRYSGVTRPPAPMLPVTGAHGARSASYATPTPGAHQSERRACVPLHATVLKPASGARALAFGVRPSAS